ncbi:MAG: hypothetical protein ABH986_06080 [archaeon]
MPKLPRPITRKVAGKLATKKVRALHGNAGKQERALYNQLKGQKKAIRRSTAKSLTGKKPTGTDRRIVNKFKAEIPDRTRRPTGKLMESIIEQAIKRVKKRDWYLERLDERGVLLEAPEKIKAFIEVELNQKGFEKPAIQKAIQELDF